MYFSLNDIKNLTEERINDLKKNQIPESKILDYKEKLPGDTKEEKIDFLGDVSSFANADGGNIIYGIKEEKGIPADINGIESNDPDAEIQRLENLIRDCTDPRLQGIVITTFKLKNNKYVFIFYIPRSFNSPHVVKIGTFWRFYSRSSASSYKIEVSELRSIFNLSSSMRDKIRDFRIDRIARIKNRDLQIPISDEPKFIYHIIPFSSFNSGESINISKFEYGSLKYGLFHGFYKIFNYEGILAHNHQTGYADLYIQIFRNGAIEIYNSQLHDEKEKVIYRNGFENELINEIPKYISVLNFFDLNLPLLMFLSVLDIKGYKIKLNSYERERERQNRPFIQNDFLLSEVLIDENTLANLPLALKPIFDTIWNAAGHPQSPNYNDKGEWNIEK